MQRIIVILLLLALSPQSWSEDCKQEIWIAMNWPQDSGFSELAEFNSIVPAFKSSSSWKVGKVGPSEYDKDGKPELASLNLRNLSCKNSRAELTYTRFSDRTYYKQDLFMVVSAKPDFRWGKPDHRWGGWYKEERASPIVFATRPIRHVKHPAPKTEPAPPLNLCRALDAIFDQDPSPSQEEKFSKPYSKYISSTASQTLGKNKVYVVEILNAPYDVIGKYWLLARPEGEFTLIGGGLELLLAGDFDGDGSTDAIFFESAENEDGFLLAYAGLTKTLTYSWHYH